jgi:hypothetical protein
VVLERAGSGQHGGAGCAKREAETVILKGGKTVRR